MTGFEIREFTFDRTHVRQWAPEDPRYRNWPVVYTLGNAGEIYVGESRNVVARFRQHADSSDKQRLHTATVVIDSTFNKSVCLDLESYLIRLFAGDGRYQVLNRNEGVTDADYYERPQYHENFQQIFEALRLRGAFSRPVREIENTDLFKLSPFKALTSDQAIAIDDILSGLFDDIESGLPSKIVIQGDPGTGKTVVAIYLMKLLSDIQHSDPTVSVDGDSLLSEFFTEGHPELLHEFRVGLVVPQQSLRRSIQNVFRKTSGLHPSMVLTPFEVGETESRFDLLIVDETHRLNQRANQASGVLNKKFATVNERLFGMDDPEVTQLDWITARSQHQIFLMDGAQSVRPNDVSLQTLNELLSAVDLQNRRYRLTTQMRVQAGADYVGYVRGVLGGDSPVPETFDGYDLRLYDDLGDMLEAVRRRDAEHGLARTVAGYAWPWRSKRDRTAYDIAIEDVRLRWNTQAVDWVNSPGSVDEAGSIHTIQGYDLNYAGVIIGKDLRYDPVAGTTFFDRSQYFDKKGMQNNPARGIVYSDEELLQYVRNIYAVLLTRGILGTYIYVCDDELRRQLATYVPAAPTGR